VFFATYTPPQKTDQTCFAACGRQTLRGLFDKLSPLYAKGIQGRFLYDLQPVAAAHVQVRKS
jgi:hypothetical protein